MQFFENTRSRSSLIECFRHFFIDMSIFERQGGTPSEGEGKAASSRPARHGGQAAGTPPHAKRKAPRSQNEHGHPERRRIETADPSPRSPKSGDRVRDDNRKAGQAQMIGSTKANDTPKRAALARTIRE